MEIRDSSLRRRTNVQATTAAFQPRVQDEGDRAAGGWRERDGAGVELSIKRTIIYRWRDLWRHGGAVTVEIKTGKRKLIEYLLSPLMRMTDEAARER
jgi:hypothetical protein